MYKQNQVKIDNRTWNQLVLYNSRIWRRNLRKRALLGILRPRAQPGGQTSYLSKKIHKYKYVLIFQLIAKENITAAFYPK